MFRLFLTPASISYLAESILALAITIYFLSRAIKNKRDGTLTRPHHLFVAAYFLITVLCSLFFWDASSLPAQWLFPLYLENTVLALALVILVQFAYHFPTRDPKRNIEEKIALAFTLAYFLWELGVSIRRYGLLLQDGQVEFREIYLDYLAAGEFAWIFFIFVWNALKDRHDATSRRFALIALIPLWLVILESQSLSYEFILGNSSVGILAALFLFAFNYAISLPEATSFMAKISGTFLISILAILSAIAWIITPIYESKFISNLPDHRTLLFTPDSEGGYKVTEIPFQFETDLGTRTEIAASSQNLLFTEIDFNFTFFGKTYKKIYIKDDGIISFDQLMRSNDAEYNFGAPASIIPLYMDMDAPKSGEGGVYMNESQESLVITWYKMPARRDPLQTATVQVALLKDLSITIAFNGLPNIPYEAMGNPRDRVWVVGFKPELQTAALADFSQLPTSIPANGAMQDEYQNFRGFLNELMRPLAWSVLGFSLLLILAIPALLNLTLARPLNMLLQGVQSVQPQIHQLELPVQANDEIGFLTASFNSMTAELDSLISNLEGRVEKRTSELIDANRALQSSQRFFEGLFEVSPDAILTVNEQGVITRVNARAEIVFGYTRAELVGKEIEVLVPSQFTKSHLGQRAVYQNHPRTLAVGENGIIHGRRKNGREFPIDILLSPFESKDGQLTLAVIRDITDRLEMEKALRRRNETLAALDQIIFDLINRHDADDILHTFLEKAGVLLDTPEVSIDLLQNGDTLRNFASMEGLPIQAGDLVQRGEGALLSWQAVDTRQPVTISDYSTWEHRRSLFEGYSLHAVMIVPILQGERVLGTINFTRSKPDHPFGETDIFVATQLAQMVSLTLNNSQLYSQLRSELAERRQIEEVLRISQENFMSYFNMGTVGMCVITPEKDWVEVNDRLCKMLGYTRDELKEIHWNDLTHPNDLDFETSLFEQTLREEYESREMNKRFLRKDGSVAYTSMYVSCQRHTDQSAWYFLVSLVDITERILQEQALQQTQAELMEQKLTSATLEERQRLARNLHDSLSQSVHSLVLFSQTLQSALEKNNIDRARRIVEQVQDSARQSHKETRLLLFELQAPGKGRRVDLIHDLESRLAKVENHAGIGSQIVQKGSVKDIPSAWLEDLYWITIEALNNALKHAQARKMKIVIDASPDEVELEVIDDGRGFSVEKVGAGGMGLANLRDRAALLGGELTIESELSKGTRVRFHAKIKEQHG
jgi:PAS domain S-box-containing protein